MSTFDSSSLLKLQEGSSSNNNIVVEATAAVFLWRGGRIQKPTSGGGCDVYDISNGFGIEIENRIEIYLNKIVV